MIVKITDFGARHFDPKFGGTKVLNYSVAKFEEEINSYLNWIEDFDKLNKNDVYRGGVKIIDGYAPFCKLIAIPNFTDARVGSMPITLENYQYIRSGYSARRDEELPVFSRWLELPLGKPKAEWLILILYSKEQIDKESKDNTTCEFVPFDADWGIVAILGQSHPNEEPMKPETMLRNSGYNTEEYQKKLAKMIESVIEKFSKETCNYVDTRDALAVIDEDIKEILSLQGKLVGGSGVALDKEKYLASVDFWSKNATVK